MKKPTRSAPKSNPVVENQPAETPAVHLLPLCLGRLAEHSDLKDSASRFALKGVQIEFQPDNTFAATATDTNQLVRIEGPCHGNPADYPVETIPALAHAPNGSVKAVVPSTAWLKAFASATKLTKRTHLTKTVPVTVPETGVTINQTRPNELKSLAVVLGDKVTTLAATDTESNQCDSTPNVEGRFPSIDDILNKSRREATSEKTTRFAVDPEYLARICATAKAFTADDNCRLEFEVIDSDKPILMHATNGELKMTALLMPLAG